MNKSEFITAIASSTGYTKKDTTAFVDAMVDVITKTLTAGEEVSLSGLGKFKVNERAAREGRNPLTGEPMSIAATKVPSFKAAKNLKDAIKGE